MCSYVVVGCPLCSYVVVGCLFNTFTFSLYVAAHPTKCYNAIVAGCNAKTHLSMHRPTQLDPAQDLLLYKSLKQLELAKADVT